MKEVRIVQKVLRLSGTRRAKAAPACLAFAVAMAAAAPAHGWTIEELSQGRADLAGLSPLLAFVFGLSLLLSLVGLFLMVRLPRLTRQIPGDDGMPQLAIPLPDQRAESEAPAPSPALQQPPVPVSPEEWSRLVRLSEAVAAARAKMSIEEEERSDKE